MYKLCKYLPKIRTLVGKSKIVFIVLLILFTDVLPVMAVTFTAGSAKRDAPGPFIAAPIVQGDPNNASSLTDDVVSFPQGTQVSGNFYSNFDTTTGSIVFWWTPEFGSADLNGSGDHYLWYANSSYYMMYEYDNNQYSITIGGQTMTSASTITAGTTYGLAVRWDTQNTLSGSNYVCLTIDDGTASCGITTQPTVAAPASTIYIGSDGSTGGASGLIEYFTVYRRPLYDGSVGMNGGFSLDEVAAIKASGGSDPSVITGSWDVVFALPTNSSTGAFSTGTGHAWSHPYTSNLLYTSTTNTGGFMLNGTYTSDGWADEGTPTSVAALAAANKIFAGGYSTTSDAANEGIYYNKTVTEEDNWIVRALAHSDGTSTPSIELWDTTNNVAIATQSGTTTSTRTAPDTFIFAGQARTGQTNLRVKLINTASSGVTYWHQVEVLSNTITNPSIESWNGTDPDIPTGWTNKDIEAGQTTKETTTVHSGSNAIRLNGGSDSDNVKTNSIGNGTSGNFYSMGGLVQWVSGQISVLENNAGDKVYFRQNTASTAFVLINLNQNANVWKLRAGIARSDASGDPTMIIGQGNAVGNFIVDDVYVFGLNNVSLTITPATQANSTENTDEVRVDGRDVYSASSSEATSITATTGYTSFNWRPRHAAADSVKLAETTSDDAYIVSFTGDSNDYIYVYWDSANTITMSYNMSGTTGSGTWDATGAIAANTEYALILSYTGSSTMTLSVDGTTRITLSSIPASFGTAPNNPVYFGSDTSSSNQGDATFSSIVFDATAPSISLTALSPDPNNDTTPALTGTATEAIGTVADVEFQMDGTGGAWTDCTADDAAFDEASEPFTCTVTSALSAGSHTMYVRATDSNNNTTGSGSESSDAFTIDATAPTISVTALTPDPTTDTTPSVTGTATDATTVLTAIQFQVDSTSGSWTTCTADDGAIDETSEAFTCTTSALSDGSHTIYVRATDNASNTSSNASDSFTVDTTAPAGFSIESPSNNSYTNNTHPQFIWKKTTDATSGVNKYKLEVGDISIDNIEPSSTTDKDTTQYFIHNSTNTISLHTKDTYGLLKEGKHTVKVTAYDNAGNTKEESSTFIVDLTNPSLSVSYKAPILSGTITDTYYPEKVQFTLFKQTKILGVVTSEKIILSETQLFANDKNKTSFNFSFTTPYLKAGYYKIEVKGFDKAGNNSVQNKYIQISSRVTIKLNQQDEEVLEEQEQPISIPDIIQNAKQAKVGKAYDLIANSQLLFSHLINILKSSADFTISTADTFASNINSKTFQTIDYIAVNTQDSLITIHSEVTNSLNDMNSTRLAQVEKIQFIETSLPQVKIDMPSNLFTEISDSIEKSNEDVKPALSSSSQLVGDQFNHLTYLVDTQMKGVASTLTYSMDTISTDVAVSNTKVEKELLELESYTKQNLLTLEKTGKETVKFLNRVKVGFASFYAHVFDPATTKISDVTIEEIGSDYIIVSWTTNHYTTNNKVNFGENLSYGEEAWAPDGEKYHKVNLENLKPNTKYYFEVMSQNKNYTYDAYYSFTTKRE